MDVTSLGFEVKFNQGVLDDKDFTKADKDDKFHVKFPFIFTFERKMTKSKQTSTASDVNEKTTGFTCSQHS